MRRIPSFPLLRAFDAAARAQSFTGAATELHLTPSAVSHQIKELEEFLNCALFERLHRRVELTAEGRLFSTRIVGIFDSIDAACAEVRLFNGVDVLHVHAAPSFAAKWLGPRLKSFTEAYPTIALSISSTAEPVDLVKDRGTDIGISYARAIRRDGILVVPLGTEEIAPMCAPAIRQRASVARDVLYAVPLIGSPLSLMTWENWFRERDLPMPSGRRMSFDRAAMGISAAAEGMGVVLETVRLAQDELESGALVRLDPEQLPSSWACVHFVSIRTQDVQLPRIQEFARWLFTQSDTPVPPELGA